MQNKDIYQSLYDQQERFRNNFPTLSDFETYVSTEGKLDEIKDIYQFDENSIVDPLKKKENGASRSGSPFQFFPKREKDDIKVQPGSLQLGASEYRKYFDLYENLNKEYTSLRSEFAIQDIPGSILSMGLSSSPNAYSTHPEIMSMEQSLNELAPFVQKGMNELVYEYYGPMFRRYTEVFKDDSGERQEIIQEDITDDGRLMISKFSGKRSNLVASDFGQGDGYLIGVDAQKVREAAEEIYRKEFVEEGTTVGPFGMEFSHGVSIDEMHNDSRYKFLVESITATVQKGIEIQNINNAISAELRKEFPDNVEIQRDGYKAIGGAITYKMSHELYDYTKQKELEINKQISGIVGDVSSIDALHAKHIDSRLEFLKTKYNWDQSANKFIISEEQFPEFEAQYNEYTKATQEFLDISAEAKQKAQEDISAIISDGIQEIKDTRKSITEKYTVGDYDTQRVGAAIKRALSRHGATKVKTEQAAYDESIWNAMGAGFVQGSGSLLRGVSKQIDLYLNQFQGMPGFGIGTAIESFGDDLLEYEYKSFAPKFGEASIFSFEGFKKGMYDISRMAPTLLPTIGMAMAGAPLPATALVGFIGDTSMEIDEVTRQVFDATGSRIKAEKAALDKVESQLGIGATYIVDAGLFMPRAFGKVFGLGSALRVGATRFGLTLGEELVQESIQNANTKSIIDSYVYGRDVDYSWVDEIFDPEMAKSVFYMTSVIGGVSGSVDTYSQLKAEKNLQAVNTMLGDKGITNIVHLAGENNRGLVNGYYEVQHMMGNITLEQLMNIKKATKRAAQFSDAATLIAPNASQKNQAIVLSLLSQKEALQAKANEIENETAKETLKQRIKDIDKNIGAIAEGKSVEGYTIVTKKDTGTIISAIPNEELKETIANNPNAATLFDAEVVGALTIETEDETINNLKEFANSTYAERDQFNNELNGYFEETRQEERQRRRQQKKGEIPSLTDEEFHDKVKKGFIDIIKKRNERIKNRRQLGEETQKDIDRYKKQNEDETISGVQFDPIFNVDENTNFDDIKLKFNNPKIDTIANQTKEYLPMLRQLFPNAKVTFVKSNKDMASLGYDQANGLFDPDTNTLFVNLEGADEYTFLHEFTHAALIKAFGAEGNALMFGDFVKDIERALGPEQAARLKNFVVGYSPDMVPEEYLAQLGSFIGIDQTALKPGTMTRIKAAIYNVLQAVGMQKLAAKFNTDYNQKNVYDLFNSLGKAYKSKDMGTFLKKAADVNKSRYEKNAYVRSKNKDTNNESIQFAEGVLSELSNEFGMANTESDKRGIYFDPETNSIVHGADGVFSTDDYFKVISDVFLHNFIVNNTEEFFNLADQIDRAGYKKLRAKYEAGASLAEISALASRSMYTFLSKGSQITNMPQLWQAISNYYVGTNIQSTAGLYGLATRYFNKKTSGNVNINPIDDATLRELSKMSKDMSIYSVIDMHKNGFDLFTIKSKVRQSIDKIRLMYSAIEALKMGNKFPEYSLNMGYDVSVPSIDFETNTINMPQDFTDSEAYRMLINIVLLGTQQSKPRVFVSIFDKIAEVSNKKQEFDEYKKDPDNESKAQGVFNTMVDYIFDRTNNLLDEATDEKIRQIEDEIFKSYQEPFEIPLLDNRDKNLDYVIYKLLDPNSSFFFDQRMRTVEEYHNENLEQFEKFAALVDRHGVVMNNRSKQMAKIPSEAIIEFEESIYNLFFGFPDFLNSLMEAQEKMANELGYDDKINTPIDAVSELVSVLEYLQNKPKDNFASIFIQSGGISMLNDRVLFERIFENNQPGMDAFDKASKLLSENAEDIYTIRYINSILSRNENAVLRGGEIRLSAFDPIARNYDNPSTAFREIANDYRQFINQSGFEKYQYGNNIIKDLRNKITDQMATYDPNLMLSDKYNDADGLEFTVKDKKGNIIDNINILLVYDTNENQINITFKSEKFELGDTPTGDAIRALVPNKVAEIAMSSFSFLPVKTVYFSAAESKRSKFMADPGKYREALYSAIGKRIVGEDFFRAEQAGYDGIEISVPPLFNIGRLQGDIYAPDDFSYYPQIKKDNTRESRRKNNKKITAYIDAQKDAGTPNSEIFKNAYNMFGDEDMRTSSYGAEYQAERDKFQTQEAIAGMTAFSNEFNMRRQGIIDFIDKYRDRASLLKLVNVLRRGVGFTTDTMGNMYSTGNPDLSSEFFDPEAAQVIDVAGQNQKMVKFADYEIFLALYAMGETSEDLAKIFGGDYRQTVETAINKGQFSSSLLGELTDNAQSQRIRRRIEDLSMLGSVFDNLDPTALIESLVKSLDRTGVEPAVQNIIDKMKKAKTFQDVNGAVAEGIADMSIKAGDVQALATLASFSGRILRLMRQLSDDPTEVILESAKMNGRELTKQMEDDIRDRVKEKMEKLDYHKQALDKAWQDPTDKNIQDLIDAEKALDNASWELDRLVNTAAVRNLYWSDILTKHGAFALLSMNTVFLSQASVMEVLYREQFAPLSNYAAFLADKYGPGSVPVLNNYRVASRKNPFGKEFWRNSALAHRYTFDQNMFQMGRGFLTGTMTTSSGSSLHYDLPAQANAVRDAANFFEAMNVYVKKMSNGQVVTDEDIANVLERAVIDVNGDKKLPGGQAYSVAAAAFRGLNPSFLFAEGTARLMALGLDQPAVNILMMDQLLDYTSFQMAANTAGLPMGVSAAMMQSNAATSLRNAAIMTQSLIAAGYIENDAATKAALKATFFNANKLTRGLGNWRRTMRKNMDKHYGNYLEELKRGKGNRRVSKIIGSQVSLQAWQIGNLATYAAIPFLRVPSNIAFALITRGNPLMPSIRAFKKYNDYKEKVADFQNKYKNYVPPVINNNSVTIKDAAEAEQDMLGLFEAKREFTGAVGDIIYGSTLAGVAYTIVMSGALTPSDDPDKRGLQDELGLESSELNVSMLKDYLMAGGPNMTEAERKNWILSRQRKTDDLKVSLINLGTYFGYTLGFASDIYQQYTGTLGDKNQSMFGAMQRHFTTGQVLSTMSRTVFKMTPSAQFMEEVIQTLTTSTDYEKDLQDLLANLASAAGASFAPSLLGKPLSVSEGIKAQRFGDIDLDREIGTLPNELRFLVNAHMRLSRNGFILPGTWRSDFYKAKIGIFGEDLSIRKTFAEPGTTAAMLESTLNFMKLRRNSRVMPKNKGDEDRLAFEIARHEKVNEAMMGVLNLANAYSLMGGDPSSFYKLFNRPNKNSFIVTDIGEGSEGINLDVPIKLPNDIFRAEARLLGEYRAQALDLIIQQINDALAYSPDGKSDYTEAQIDEFKEHIEGAIGEIEKLVKKQEQAYLKDFLLNRSSVVLREMNDRGILSKSDYNKIIQRNVDETIFTSPEYKGLWKLDIYKIGDTTFNNPILYNPNAGDDNEVQDDPRFEGSILYLPPEE